VGCNQCILDKSTVTDGLSLPPLDWGGAGGGNQITEIVGNYGPGYHYLLD